MKNLKKMLERLEYTCVQGDTDIEISALVYDSRKASKNDLFVCIEGTVVDGHDFICQVAEAGVSAIVISKDVKVPQGITVIKVNNTRVALAGLSAAFFDYPADTLKVIGITGTKGKTTTTYMIKSILETAGHKVGLIVTIEAIIGDTVIPANNTTPESYVTQEYFSRMLQAGCDICVMEVSSQGLMMHRCGGFVFEIGIFTNIEPDHISPTEHRDFEDYMYCKSLLFRQCKLGIINGDDPHYQEIIKNHICEIETYGFREGVHLQAIGMELLKESGDIGVAYDTKGVLEERIEIDLPGRFSVYNSLAAIAVCRHFKVELAAMKKALKEAKVKGRIEKVPASDNFTIMIDYAHNAMSLESLLTTLKEYEPQRLVCVFGCGGNRSKLRRYEMGEVAGRLADLTIITSDNPRFEEPQDIINDIKVGLEKTTGKYVEIIDRKEAIRYAINNGRDGDVIVVAGKGHEDYQEIKGEKFPMDDRKLVQEVAQELKMI